jgi:hypothetical protein
MIMLHHIWECLSEVFPEQSVGQSGPTAWPARASDISHLEYISGDIKSLLFLVQDIQFSLKYNIKMKYVLLLTQLSFYFIISNNI